MPVINPSTISRARKSSDDTRASVRGSRYFRTSAVASAISPSAVGGDVIDEKHGTTQGEPQPHKPLPHAKLFPDRVEHLRRRLIAEHLRRLLVELVVLLARDEVD